MAPKPASAPPARELDPEVAALCVHIPDYLEEGRSSSAAKKANAVPKISFARFNSVTSFLSRRISAFYDPLTPGRGPAMTSAWRTYLRSFSGPTPNRVATLLIVDHSVSWPERLSVTKRINRSLKSLGQCFGIVSSSNKYRI